MDIVFTDEQHRLIDEMLYWFKNKTKPYYSYTGCPGTGKTTVIKEFINQANLSEDDYIACAYVGKAVLRMLQSGLRAITIHSLIYHTIIESVYDDENEDINGNTKRKTKMKFELRDTLKFPVDLIIVDEAPMVNDKMIEEILSFGIPVIFCGDTDQLPPIFGVSSVMMYPDFRLTKIMRQSEDDPIVFLSRAYLDGRDVPYGKYGLSEVIEEYPVDSSTIRDYDQILCGKNATRDYINNTIRAEVLHRKNIDPVIGDKVICRQNNWDLDLNGIYLTNGLIGFITDLSKSRASKGCMKINFQPDFMDSEFENIPLDLKYIRSNYALRNNWGISKFEKFEYGYAITTHLSQGSEYPKVLFYDEYFNDKEFLRRLRYTAISRAKDAVTIVIKKPKKPYWLMNS